MFEFNFDGTHSPKHEELFGHGLNYEISRGIAQYRSWLARGYVTAVVYPSRQVSLGYEDERPESIAGFYPPLTAGRLPAAPGEAVISQALPGEKEPGPEFGVKPDIVRRELGVEITLWDAKPVEEYRVVGLTACGNSIYDTIWAYSPEDVAQRLAGYPPPGGRASVILPMPVQYDRLREQIVALGADWSAHRIVGGRLDSTWRNQGHDYARLRMQVDYQRPPEISVHLQQRAPTAPPPIPLADTRLEFDGKPVTVDRKDWDGKPFVNIGPGGVRGKMVTVLPPGRYRVCAYIQGKLDTVIFADIHK